MKHWYVIHTQTGAEEKAASHLANQAFEVYLPRIRKRWRHARRTRTVLRPLFPRYLFVQIDVDEQAWRSIRGTIGVSQIICQGERPLPIEQTVIDEIRAREDEDGLVTLQADRLKRGDRLRMLEGAFADLVGIFDEAIDERRVIVLLSLLGRQVRLKAPLWALASAES